MPIEDYLDFKQSDITWINRVLAAEGITSKDDLVLRAANHDKGSRWAWLKHIGPKRDEILSKLVEADDEQWVRVTGLPVHAQEPTPFGEQPEPEPTAAQQWG